MEDNLKQSRLSVLIHVAVGLAIGLISPFLGRSLYAIGLALAVALIVGKVTERLVGKKGFGWWLGNGLFVYLFVWFDAWVFMANYF